MAKLEHLTEYIAIIEPTVNVFYMPNNAYQKLLLNCLYLTIFASQRVSDDHFTGVQEAANENVSIEYSKATKQRVANITNCSAEINVFSQ